MLFGLFGTQSSNKGEHSQATAAKAVSSSNSPQGGAASQSTAIAVSAERLLADYKTNEIAADEKYKGHLLEITGTVETIGKDVLDNMYVSLKSGQEFDFRSVQCYFGQRFAARAASLQPGQRITIRGRCKGLFGTVGIDDSVFLDQ